MAEEKKRSHKIPLTFVTRLTIVFAIVAAFTAILAIVIISLTWNVYFNQYTDENVQTIANNTANRIALLCDNSDELLSDCVYPAEQSALVSADVGIKVLDTNGNTFYDSAKDPVVIEEAEKAGVSSKLSQPSNPEQIALANIIVDQKVIGSVRVWVYGSSALMSRLDLEFRDNSYKSLLVAGIGAVAASSILGLLFARGLMAPINKLSRTALAVKEGDLSARANIKGDDELAKLGETFDEMVASVEKDRQLERRLISDVAHELRTPLMGIQSVVEAMIDGVYKADDDHLQLVNEEVKRLSRLVDALLKLSRLENRSQQMREEHIDLGELVHDIALTHKLLVEESGLKLEFETEPDIIVIGDSDMLRQAVVNLMSNAVRYTPEGGKVQLTVRKAASFAEVRVADTGIGISSENLKMVFSRFWRADEGRSRASGGLGVGLSIVKEVVDRHKGSVSVESELGKGTAFTIKLPLYVKRNKPEEKISGNPRTRWLREKPEAAAPADSRGGGH